MYDAWLLVKVVERYAFIIVHVQVQSCVYRPVYSNVNQLSLFNCGGVKNVQNLSCDFMTLSMCDAVTGL